MQGQLYASQTGYLTMSTTQWMLMYGSDTLRVMDELRALTGNFRQRVTYRTAPVLTDQPGAWATPGAARIAVGSGTQDFDLSTTTNALWVQAAVQGSASSADGEALSFLQASLHGKSTIVAARTLEIGPSTNSGQTSVVPLCTPIDALGLTGFMAGFVLTGVSGTLNYGIQWRTYTSRDYAAGAWSSLYTDSASADEVVNSGHLGVVPGTVMFAQPGLSYSGDARGTMRVIVAAKW